METNAVITKDIKCNTIELGCIYWALNICYVIWMLYPNHTAEKSKLGV